MQRYFYRGMLALPAALLALTAATGFVAYHSLRVVYEARVDVGHARQVQASLQDVLSTAQDAMTGVLSYVVTGRSSDLDPYEAAAAVLESRIEEVERLTLRDARQFPPIGALRAAALNHMTQVGALGEARARTQLDPAEMTARTARAREALDALRRVVHAMRDAEGRIVDDLMESSRRGIEMAQVAATFAVLLAALTVAALARELRRGFHEHERAAAVLQDQEELYRTTLAALGEAVVTCDTQARVTFVNKAAEALTGWSAARAAGLPIEDIVRIVDPQEHRPLESSAAIALASGEPVQFGARGRMIARGGAELPVDEGAAPIRDKEGQVIGAVLVLRDITERKRFEDALIDADRRKDEFLAVLAHELRNPLAPLRNALQIVRISGSNPVTVSQMLGMMERQVLQMVRLIDDLLDVSRITRNKLELRREPLAIAEVIEAALEISAPTVARFSHRVEVDVPPDLPWVDGDRVRLVQVLDNLVTNAAKYSEPGGTITLSASHEAGRVRVAVRDTGVGIPAEMLEHIFEMFTQVDRTLERSRGGLGIGLTLVRRIVELHGGTIVARSEGPGKGSEFEFELPAISAPAAAPPRPAGLAPSMATRRRVVVAEDNPDAAETLARMLRMMGHEVRVAFDGEECVAVCEEFRPDAAVLDIGMPRLSGYEVARRIRSRPWGAAVLLVALTGWGQESDKRRAREAGFDQHLTKPVDFDRLAQVLHPSRRDREEAIDA